MIYIKKQKIPQNVQGYLNQIKHSESWQQIAEGDTKAIRAQFDLLPKEELRKILLKEQRELCAYCMRRISNHGHYMNIEHWFPLSKGKEDALNVKNMLGVCNGGRIDGNREKRVLCCDALKGDNKEITINPQNRQHMKVIAYKKDGTIYTEPYQEELEEDINNILGLNGLLDQNGKRIADTATEIVKGRRDAYLWCESFFKKLDKVNKCTANMIQKKIEELKQEEIGKEYIGVILYFLEKKHRQLIQREKSKNREK